VERAAARAPGSVLIAGAGAIGGWLLARLTEHGADVTGWARGEAYDRLVAGEPLVLESPDGDWAAPVRVVDSAAGDWDLVVVCVKSHDTETVSNGITPGVTVLSAQNGVENVEILRRRHPIVLGAVVYAGVERIGPLHVRNEQPGSHLLLDDAKLADWFTAHGVATRVVDDLRLAAWRKLLVNAVGNSVTAITRLRFGALRSVEEIRDVMRAGLDEVRAVGNAEGVALTDADVEAAMALFEGLPDEKTTSTLQDVEAGRPLEVDALTGVVVRKAASHGIPVPTIAVLDAVLRALSSTA
jgi:2-dehydropantoate 2-reductase